MRQSTFATSIITLILVVLLNIVLLSDLFVNVGVRNPAQSSLSMRNRFDTIQTYAVYYSIGNPMDLALYDLAIIQPNTLQPAELLELQNNGTVTIAYLSVGEVESYRPWYTDGRYDEAWTLSLNENWGSYRVDVSQQGWSQLMAEVTGEYLDLGFDGVFLDTVDTVDAYPELVEPMVDLIANLREIYPNAIIVQNRGFRVLDKTAPFIDGVMAESVFSGYDFATQTYYQRENLFAVDQLINAREQYNIIVLSLDYTAPGNTDAAADLRSQAEEVGFIPFVSEITLQTPP
jgi:uncharacterized protein (TIGR01370 family)